MVAAPEASADGNSQHAEVALAVNSLTYAYPGQPPAIHDFTLQLPKGSRCLLLGANGAGKTTVLQILAGKHMVPTEVVRVLGRSAFHDLQLTSTGQLGYLGTQWRRSVASAGVDIPLQGDIAAGDMIFGVEGVDPERRQRLIDLLDIDLGWRLNKVSDGQRRRVQIAMGLLKPYEVLLLDEITVDMDVVGRLDLLDFFRQECEERGATIVYATHIFDGLEEWITHLAYVANGELVRGGAVSEVPGMNQQQKLLTTVEAWLRDDRNKRKGAERAEKASSAQQPGTAPKPAIPYFPSKQMAFFR